MMTTGQFAGVTEVRNPSVWIINQIIRFVDAKSESNTTVQSCSSVSTIEPKKSHKTTDYD